MLCITDHSPEILYRVMNRAGYIREAGIVLDKTSILDEPPVLDIKDVEYVKTSVPYQIVSRRLVEEYVKKFMDKNKITRRYGSGKYIHIVFNEYGVIIGLPQAFRDTRSFNQRRPSKRPFFRSIALSVPFSRALINLAHVEKGMTLLDPFTGTGSIVIEAGLMGLKPIGVEIDWELVHGARINLEHLGIKNYVLILGDSTELKLYDIDAIATDPPYGRAASTHGVHAENIYERFLYNASEWIKGNRYVVFLAPHYLMDKIDELTCNAGFIIRVKIPYFVHGGLTRIIYVLYKP